MFIILFTFIALYAFTWLRYRTPPPIQQPPFLPPDLPKPAPVAVVDLPGLPPTPTILADLKDAMRHSWKAYVDYAWGADEVKILSKRGSLWMDQALTMVDSLDTLWMFGMTSEFTQASKYIEERVNFDSDRNSVSVFESTIRFVGGLLSAYHLSGDSMFLKKAVSFGSISAQRILA